MPSCDLSTEIWLIHTAADVNLCPASLIKDVTESQFLYIYVFYLKYASRKNSKAPACFIQTVGKPMEITTNLKF